MIHGDVPRRGFTIVELLIVIVVIGILAAITIVAYNGVQTNSQVAKMQADLTQLSNAIQMGRQATSKVMGQITGSYYTASSCVGKAAGTDLASLPRTDSCWTSYLSALNNISAASGTNVQNLVDPWGRPYFIDENEGEGGGCGYDALAAYAQPFNGGSRYPGTSLTVPHIGLTGCPL